MKPTSTLAILSGFFALTYAYILDHTCGPYSDMLLPPIDGAFDLALAGVESLHSLATLNKGSGDIWQAQFNLLKYIFAETLTNNEIDTTNPHVSLAAADLFFLRNKRLIIYFSGKLSMKRFCRS